MLFVCLLFYFCYYGELKYKKGIGYKKYIGKYIDEYKDNGVDYNGRSNCKFDKWDFIVVVLLRVLRIEGFDVELVYFDLF